MLIFRDAKKTLPKPKVGDFCTNAMEQGFSDACIALCMEQEPVSRIAQSCRAAAVEMPRPTGMKQYNPPILCTNVPFKSFPPLN
jgi:hypothetical protein